MDSRVTQLTWTSTGVGPARAKEWYDAGVRTLEDLKDSKKFGITLTSAQELGLKYYNDINERIPRAEVARHFQKIQRAALSIDHYLIVECMGSFRRGRQLFTGLRRKHTDLDFCCQVNPTVAISTLSSPVPPMMVKIILDWCRDW